MLVAHSTLDTYVGHFADASELEGLLYNAFRKSDTYYVRSRDWFGSLVTNVIARMGCDAGQRHIIMNLMRRDVLPILTEGNLRSNNLKNMIQRASVAIDVYESDGSSLAQMFREEQKEKTHQRELQRAQARE